MTDTIASRGAAPIARTVGHMFVHALQRHPGRAFVRWLDGGAERSLTYTEAARVLAGIVQALRGRGVGPGDRVVVATEDIRRSLMFDVGCALAGAVHVPAIPPTPSAVERLARRVEAKVVFATGHEARALVDDGLRPVCLDDDVPGAEMIAAVDAPDDVVAGLVASAADQVDGASVYMLQPTSGTTSDPKLVMRQHQVFVRVARLLSFDLEPEGGERFLMVAALTHGLGQYLVATGLSLAATFVVPTDSDTASSLAEVRQLDPTYIGITPRVLRSYVAQHGGTAAPGALFGPGARTLLTGGSKSDAALLEYVDRQGVRVAEGFGASEFSLVAIAPPGTWRQGVIGPVLPDVTLKVAADGQLLARTPGLMLGYFGDPALTRAAFDDDGFYRTGDRCEIAATGELTYLGRASDVFNIHGGVNVSPQLAEHELERLCWVDQALLLGDQKPWVGALVVPIPGLAGCGPAGEAMAEIVRRDVGRINDRLDPAARIRSVRLLDRPLGDDVYRVVGHGKISRHRAAADLALAADVAALFGGPEGAIQIPGAETDRRRGARSELSWLAQIEIDGRVVCGYTRDVSRTGALIDIDIDHSGVGAACEVTLFVARQPIRLAARIARRAGGATAVEFVDARARRTALTELLPR